MAGVASRPSLCPFEDPDGRDRPQDLHNPHGGGNSYILERKLDQDMLLTSVGWANSYYSVRRTATTGRRTPTSGGLGGAMYPYETRFGRGHYTEIVGHPLADDRAIESYQAPDPTRPELYLEAERVIREFKDDYWIVGVTVTTIFETAWALRGYPQSSWISP